MRWWRSGGGVVLGEFGGIVENMVLLGAVFRRENSHVCLQN
jgi:hypothetical protein